MSEVRLHVSDMDAYRHRAPPARRTTNGSDGQEQPGEVAFESMDLLLSVLTPGRWRLLQALRLAGATSICGLSQLLDRDYRSVHADVFALLEAGLIETDADNRIFVGWDRITAEMQTTN
jgi:predicted transcriptional regulator